MILISTALASDPAPYPAPASCPRFLSAPCRAFDVYASGSGGQKVLD